MEGNKVILKASPDWIILGFCGIQWGHHFCSTSQYTPNALLRHSSQILCVPSPCPECVVVSDGKAPKNSVPAELPVLGCGAKPSELGTRAVGIDDFHGHGKKQKIPSQCSCWDPPALQPGRAEAQCCFCFPALIPACSSVLG